MPSVQRWFLSSHPPLVTVWASNMLRSALTLWHGMMDMMVLRVFSNLSDSMIPWQGLCPCDCAHHRRARRGIWKQTLGWSVSSLGTKQPSDGEREVSASTPSAWRSPGFYGQLQTGFWSSGGWHLPSEQYLVQNTCFCREDSAREPKEQLHIIALLSLFSYKRKPLHIGTQLLFQVEKKYRMLLKLNCGEKHPPLFSLTTLFCFLIDIWKCTVSRVSIHMNLLPETNVTENLPQD